jgi:hypothetical protein
MQPQSQSKLKSLCDIALNSGSNIPHSGSAYCHSFQSYRNDPSMCEHTARCAAPHIEASMILTANPLRIHRNAIDHRAHFKTTEKHPRSDDVAPPSLHLKIPLPPGLSPHCSKPLPPTLMPIGAVPKLTSKTPQCGIKVKPILNLTYRSHGDIRV